MLNSKESIDAVLAKNLVVARVVTGVTQQVLAARSDISRATIAQIETGYSDPRLSTVASLAEALGIPLILLLAGIEEVRAITALLDPPAAPASGDPPPVRVRPRDVDRMQRLLQSGMLRDRVRAARVGAAVAQEAGRPDPMAHVSSAIFSAILPGRGTVAGIRLAERFAQPAIADP